MDTWQILLVVFGSIGLMSTWIIIGLGSRRRWSLRREILLLIGICLLVTAPVVPVQQAHARDESNREAEAQDVVDSFMQMYTNTTLLRIDKPDDTYFAYRTDDGENILVSILCADLFGEGWVEIGQLTVPDEDQSPEP